MNGKEMCETIIRAGILVKSDGTAPTAEEIWYYSPTGELNRVFLWYDMARCVLGEMTAEELCTKWGISNPQLD